VLSSDLPGVNPATFNGMILYYRLITKRSGLGDSTELLRMGLSHLFSASKASQDLEGNDALKCNILISDFR
jgi:hypothetical protein